MHVESAAWYSSATAWAAMGVIAVIVIGIATILAMYKTANKRNKLSCVVRYNSLLGDHTSYGDLLKVTYNDQAVDAPTVVNIWLYNTGKMDIPSDSFDGGRPFIFDLGATVVAELPTQGEHLPADKFWIEGSRVMIGPWVIYSNLWLTANLLVDGIPENVQMISPILNTDLNREVTNQAASIGASGGRLSPLRTLLAQLLARL